MLLIFKVSIPITSVFFFLFSTTESFYETFIWYEHVPPIPMTRASLLSMHTDLCIQTDIHHESLAGKERHGIVPI